MRKRIKKNIKVIAATTMCLFTLSGLFTTTLAWFSANKEVQGTGMGVTVASVSSVDILSCYAVRYDGNYGAIAIDISGGNASITMSEYDSVFLDRNVNTPLFLRMEITNFSTSDDLSVTIPCSGNYKTGNKVDPYLSNVVSARFMTGINVGGSIVADTNQWSGNDVTSQAVINSYKGMVASISNVTGTPFVSGSVKQNSITLTLNAADVFDNSLIIHRTNAENEQIDVAVVYIAFDYHVTNNVNLVSSYLDSYGSDEHSLSFASDIQIITLNNEEN